MGSKILGLCKMMVSLYEDRINFPQTVSKKV